MLEKIYLLLVTLCGIWSEGIIETRADGEIKVSSDILIRQKRVVSRILGEDKPADIKDVPYIVHIKFDSRIRCVGSILSHEIVITLATCVGDVPTDLYYVVSASSRTNRGRVHNVTDIKKHYGNHPNRPSDGVALLTVNPLFVYAANTNQIELHSEPLLEGMHGTISGWGFNCRNQDRGTDHTVRLRTIEVPIMAHRDCVRIYQHLFGISDMDICTFHPQKHCGHNDGGAPLVVDGYLAGVHLRAGRRTQVGPSYPDVFIMLQHSAYNQWITTNVRNTHMQFQNIQY